MAFSGNGPVEEWLEVRREEWDSRAEARMVICQRNDLDDTDGYVRERERNRTLCETHDVTLFQ